MKKLFIPIVAFGLVATLGSCKKAWTCNCSIVTSASGTSTTTSTTYTLNDMTHSDAQKNCDNIPASVANPYQTVTCSLAN